MDSRAVLVYGKWSLLVRGQFATSSKRLRLGHCKGTFHRRSRKKSCLASTDEAVLTFTSLREFLTAVPNASAITVLAVALTVVGSSLAYEKKKNATGTSEAGPKTSDSWLLTLSPTPFNRFVFARCPSICFDSDATIDQDVHHKLNLENQQTVTVQDGSSEFPWETTGMDYQRRCIPTEDGGILALDWPTSLDLDGDLGLDTTLVLIPGTARGSEDETMKVVAEQALRTGYFPIIVNPRGCGSSPLTTPRVFSAGDSDDVRVALAYISQSRPWTTLMAIAWGYGANMLTKYLGEEESLTPLTAAVSVNNPFDLDEATKYRKQNPLQKELTDGFVQILKSNKMLFQGHRHIDVPGGLAASSVREFEAAISAPANGFKTIERLYQTGSSGRLIDHVKTPLLCIQDGSAAPLFSIPRIAFEGNPYTTLLYTPLESKTADCNLLSIALALEWFAAVEIALLKGRHPLLLGLDLAIKPSKDWNTNIGNALTEGTDDVIEVEATRDFWASDDEQSVSKNTLPEHTATKPSVAEQEHTETSDQSAEQEEGNVSEEQGQVLQAAKTVFSALDGMMPGTLSQEIKDQVLDAVGRGETIITALQNAVPEDARGKIATAVSAAVQARGMSMQLVGFGNSFPAPTLPAGLIESMQEKLASVTKNGLKSTDEEKGSHLDLNVRSEPTSQASKSQDSDAPDENPDEQPELIDTEKDKKAEPETPGDSKQAENVQSTSPSDKPVADGTSRSSGGVQHGKTSSINMQQALQALTGLDDSTQVAVNNVFGVLDGMLDQIERENQDGVPKQLKLRPQTQADEPAEALALPVEVCEPKSEKLQLEAADSATGIEKQADELKDVHTRLKKTRIAGFILHDDKSPLKGKASSAADGFCSTKAKNLVLEAMKVEVQRRLGAASSLDASTSLKEELLKIADAVMKEVQHVEEDASSKKVLSAESMVNAAASVFRESTSLQKVVPFGVLVGVMLASLVNSFTVVTTEDERWHPMVDDIPSKESSTAVSVSSTETSLAEEKNDRGLYGNVVGAVTAAMGATAAFASGGNQVTEDVKNEGATEDDDCYKDNIVNNIAEKAFSIAAPVVPTKHGEIDHERLVAMLTDIGQKAGFLNFVGKAALLWGGLRGAMNVTDRLLVFFRIADRPLHQRLLGFTGMALLLWTPIVLPLLPTLLNEWASHSSVGVAKCACLVGLYGALIILVMIWGKRIRGYDQPLQSYGLKLKKWNLFAAGMAAGCGAVCLLYIAFDQLGYLKFVPSFLVASAFPQAALSAAKLAKLMMEAVVMGVTVAVVEEVIFRSWLIEEIAVDLGQHKAILLSGLLFAIAHRSPSAIPGLFFLAIALAGARFKAAGNLGLPIGLHAGLVAANFVFNCGGFVVYNSAAAASSWITGVDAGSPLAGLIGAAVAGILALLLYPWGIQRKTSSNIVAAT